MFGIELWSERRKRESNQLPDVFQYELIPERLRQQFLFICSDLFGDFDNHQTQANYKFIVEALRRGLGRAHLKGRAFNYRGKEFEDFIVKETSAEHVLDGFDLALTLLSRIARRARDTERKSEVEKGIAEFNLRCRQAGLGYAHEGGQLIRIDSQFLHSEAVRPTLDIISNDGYQSVNSEFRRAFDHWRGGNYTEVLVECLKAFESTMRIIADKRQWPIKPRATAFDLVNMMLEYGLIPDYYLNHFSGFRSILQSGIPTPRNRVGGHGAGTETPEPVPGELIRYVLHQTAATILFLVEADKARFG